MALMLGSTTAWAGPAPALTQLNIETVESPDCAKENVVQGLGSTRCDHGGGYLKVTVVEVGLGRHAIATLDGFSVSGTRIALCRSNQSLVPCSGSGTTAGYRYTYTLNGKDRGTFSVRNASINAPSNTLSTQIYIR